MKKGENVMSFIQFENVSKIYKTGDVEVHALKNAYLEIEEGEICVIVGESGAGKTTLLNVLGGMDTVTSGRIRWSHLDISAFSKKELAGYRRNSVGFVFQFYNLIPNLTALENVEIASQLSKYSLDPVKVLKSVGLGDRMNHFPAGLSGGEQQRVAIARALAKNPRLLLCDEPTGALDYKTGKEILKLIQDICRKIHMTAIIITHNNALTAMADRVIRVKSGRITEITLNENIIPVEDIEW